MDIEKDFVKEKRTIDINALGKFSFIFYAIVLVVFLGILFLTFSKSQINLFFLQISANGYIYSILKFIFLFAVGIALHELIHGIFFAMYAKSGFRAIKFGMMTKPIFAFYCHCKEPLIIWQYKIAAIMPLILVGIIPTLLGIFSQDLIIFLVGIILSLGAVGDVFMIRMLNNEEKDSLILDHPSEIGFYILKNKVE